MAQDRVASVSLILRILQLSPSKPTKSKANTGLNEQKACIFSLFLKCNIKVVIACYHSIYIGPPLPVLS